MYTIQSSALKLGHNKNCAKETCNKTSCVGVLGTNTEQTGLPPGIPKENINLQVKVINVLELSLKIIKQIRCFFSNSDTSFSMSQRSFRSSLTPYCLVIFL